jgi:hypothetical protein
VRKLWTVLAELDGCPSAGIDLTKSVAGWLLSALAGDDREFAAFCSAAAN